MLHLYCTLGIRMSIENAVEGAGICTSRTLFQMSDGVENGRSQICHGICFKRSGGGGESLSITGRLLARCSTSGMVVKRVNHEQENEGSVFEGSLF